MRFINGGRMESSEELFEKIEDGFSGEGIVLLLSESASPARWPLTRWEQLLIEQTREQKVDLAVVLLRECQFPARLRRTNFFDATADKLGAMRRLKRWLWQRELAPIEPLERKWSKDLEWLYATLSDGCTSVHADGGLAEDFVREAKNDFAGIFWVSCHGRTLAQVAGDLGMQLSLRLEGTTEQNCAAIREQLLQKRYLLVLDAPAIEHLGAFLAEGGRTSTLITTGPTRITDSPVTSAFARELMVAGRFAEAYELYYKLGAERPECARNLVWICEQWDRMDEANALRLRSAQPGEQMSLF